MTFATSSKFLSRASVGVIAVAGLSACTSGGPCEGLGPCPNPPEYVNLLDTVSDETSALAGVAVDSAERSVTAVGGVVERASDRITIGGVSGDLGGDRSAIQLVNSGSQLSTRYISTPAVGDRSTGVIGIATVAGDMPTIGGATYNGDTEVTIQDGINSYDLTGGATVAANFANGTVTTTLNGLSGNRVAGFGNTEAVSNVASIEIAGSTITGSTFAGGDISVTSTTLTPLSASPTTQMAGTFFGLRAAEAGGAFVVNDTTAGSLLIFGDVVSQR